MFEYRIDESRTAAAYEMGIFIDAKQRSHYNNLGHVFLRGKDRNELWHRLYKAQKGLCEICHRWRAEEKLDLDHMKGNTSRTRCDCFMQVLCDGGICLGVRLICTLDPRKGGDSKSCHAKRHGRETRFGERV